MRYKRKNNDIQTNMTEWRSTEQKPVCVCVCVCVCVGRRRRRDAP